MTITIRNDYDRNQGMCLIAADIAHVAMCFVGEERLRFIHDVVWSVVKPVDYIDGRDAVSSLYEGLRQMVLQRVQEAQHAVRH